MAWKKERTVHIDDSEWAWTHVWKGERVVLVRSPEGKVYDFRYADITGQEFDADKMGLPDELANPAITPGGVKDAILKHVLTQPHPEHEKYDIIGDVHGCFGELMDLMDKLGHKWIKNKGVHRPIGGRKIVFVGDIVDRGPRSVTALQYVRHMVETGFAIWVEGNHDNKLMRWAKGNRVTLNHGLAKTVHELEHDGLSRVKLYDFLKTLPIYVILDHGRLIVSHGGWYEGLEKAKKGKRRSWCLYGPTTGKTLENGLPERIDWAAKRKAYLASPVIVYGHQPHEEVRLINKTAGIDTGCCFGGKLTAMRWPEMEMVQIDAFDVWDKEGRKLNGFGSSE